MEKTTNLPANKQWGANAAPSSAQQQYKQFTKPLENNIEKAYTSFEEMDLKKPLLMGVFGHGFREPSEIQSRVIVPMNQGKDVIVQGKAGSGKTGCFVISSLQTLDENEHSPQIMVISPTRELAEQTYHIFKSIASEMAIEIVLLVGKQPVQVSKIQTAQVIIGTPGRLNDLLQKNKIPSGRFRTVVLDEVDELLHQGFSETVIQILEQTLNTQTQTALFSATISDDVRKMIAKQKIIREDNCVMFLLEKQELTVKNIQQFYYVAVNENDKLIILANILNATLQYQTIVYFNSKAKLNEVTKRLAEMNPQLQFQSIHGEMDQGVRNKILEEFRRNVFKVLLSTDLLCRGIDVQSIQQVINYELPYIEEKYIHRIGRSGRYGRDGIAINLITSRELETINDYKRIFNCEIAEYGK